MDWRNILDWFRPRPRPTPTPIPTPSASSDVVAAINAARAGARLRPLVADARLDATAATWAAWMAGTEVLSHGDFPARIAHAFPNTAASENIAEGHPDAAAVVAAWMDSPGHRANILGDYALIGTGRAASRGGTIYWCVDFDRP